MVLILIVLYTPTTLYYQYNYNQLPPPKAMQSQVELDYLAQKYFWVFDPDDDYITPIEHAWCDGSWFLGFLILIDFFIRLGWFPHGKAGAVSRAVKAKIREGRDEYRSWKHRNRTERIQDTGEMREWHRKGN
jgi:heme/copper-type cytochrome/quinol oxidase subunit 2